MSSEKKDNQKELQTKYIELQLLDQQIRQIQQQLTAIDTQVLELERLEQSLKEVNNTKEGTEILVPLGSGTFVKADIKNNKEVLMNVGANTIVNKKIEDALDLINKQTEELKKIISQIELNLSQVTIRAQILQSELEDSLKLEK